MRGCHRGSIFGYSPDLLTDDSSAEISRLMGITSVGLEGKERMSSIKELFRPGLLHRASRLVVVQSRVRVLTFGSSPSDGSRSASIDPEDSSTLTTGAIFKRAPGDAGPGA